MYLLNDLRLGNFFSGLAFLEDEKNIGHLSMDVNDGDREKLLMPLSNESELSITAGKPSVLELFMISNFKNDLKKSSNQLRLFYPITEQNYNNKMIYKLLLL